MCGATLSSLDRPGPGPVFQRGREAHEGKRVKTHRFAKSREGSQQEPQGGTRMVGLLYRPRSAGAPHDVLCEAEAEG